MPGIESQPARRAAGPRDQTVKRISVCGEGCAPRSRSNPSSDSRNRRVRQARFGSGFGARPLARHAACRLPDANGVRREGDHHAAKRERGDHRPIGRRELGQQPLDRVPEELFPSRDEGLLIDDEHEAAAGRDVVVRAVGRWHASRSQPRSAPVRPKRAAAFAPRGRGRRSGLRLLRIAGRRPASRWRPGRRSRRWGRPDVRSRAATGAPRGEPPDPRREPRARR